jgi:hypothetical protein
MELPFLKRKDQGAGGPTVIKHRDPDQTTSETLMHSVLEELIEALTKKDIKTIRQSLQALVLMITDKDK